MLQTITRSKQPGELLSGYGLVVVDECHHVPAPTIERTIRDLPVRRWLGLTATPQRADGLKDIMVMQCGPIRHRIEQGNTDIARALHVHDTDLAVSTPTDGLSRGEVLALAQAALVENEARTERICQDVTMAIRRDRHCLVLSGRTEHVESLANGLRRHGHEPLVLYGSMKPKERRAVHERLDADEQVLLVATDRYIGEGFDCPRLDTLFLTFPISGMNRITQYAGRILRDHPARTPSRYTTTSMQAYRCWPPCTAGGRAHTSTPALFPRVRLCRSSSRSVKRRATGRNNQSPSWSSESRPRHRFAPGPARRDSPSLTVGAYLPRSGRPTGRMSRRCLITPTHHVPVTNDRLLPRIAAPDRPPRGCSTESASMASRHSSCVRHPTG